MYRAIKYDPLNDPHYPKVGDKIDDDRKVRKVDHIEVSDLVKLLKGKLPDDAEHLIIVDNPDRPYLKYLVWWENI